MAIIIFSVLIVGGRFNIGGKESTFRTLTPTPVPGTPAPTTPISEWSISVNLEGCKVQEVTPFMKGSVTARGPINGYLNLEIQKTDGNYNEFFSTDFDTPESVYDLILSNHQGFSDSSWRINIYEGGNKSGDSWSEGTLRATQDGSPTGC